MGGNFVHEITTSAGGRHLEKSGHLRRILDFWTPAEEGLNDGLPGRTLVTADVEIRAQIEKSSEPSHVVYSQWS